MRGVQAKIERKRAPARWSETFGVCNEADDTFAGGLGHFHKFL